MSYEVGLCIGVFAFYLYDAITLVYVDEVIFALTRRGWTFNLPKASFTLNGKIPFLLGVVTPFTPRFHLYRTRTAARPPESTIEEGRYLSGLAPLRVAVTTLLVNLFVVLPAVSLFADTSWLLWSFAAVYLNCAVIAMLIVAARKRLGISGRQCVVLCVEALLCPPLAVSVIPKLSRHRLDGVDVVTFARERLSGADFQGLMAAMSNRAHV